MSHDHKFYPYFFLSIDRKIQHLHLFVILTLLLQLLSQEHFFYFQSSHLIPFNNPFEINSEIKVENAFSFHS